MNAPDLVGVDDVARIIRLRSRFKCLGYSAHLRRTVAFTGGWHLRVMSPGGNVFGLWWSDRLAFLLADVELVASSLENSPEPEPLRAVLVRERFGLAYRTIHI